MLTIKLEAKRAALFLLLALLICSCKNQGIGKLDEQQGKYQVKIAVSAGDNINEISLDTLNFLNYPFNIGVPHKGKSTSKQVIVIGKRMKSGQVVGVKPVAKVSYKNAAGDIVAMIVARPTKESLITARVQNYFELLSVHYGIQKIIDAWILYSEGLGKASDIKWESEDEAIEFFSS
jgi:hypothetical protein